MTFDEWLQNMLELAPTQLAPAQWAELRRRLGIIALHLNRVTSNRDLVPIILQIHELFAPYPHLQMASVPRIGKAPSGQLVEKLKILLLPMAEYSEETDSSEEEKPALKKPDRKRKPA